MILLLLAAGTIINVAVAWACARWSNMGKLTLTARVPVNGNPYILVDPDLSWLSSLPRDWPQPYNAVSARSTGFLLWNAHAGNDTGAGWGAQVFRFGWPCTAMEWHMLRVQAPPPARGIDPPRAPWTRHWSLDVTRWLGPRGSPQDQQVGLHQHLPLLPVWPGFAINTMVYALALWLLLAAPAAVRSWRAASRIRRGLCPKCGYDLRGTPVDAITCPECGAPRPDA